MASPQKENGYVPIANEIVEAFARTYLPSGERQVLDVILRKTYGFNKKEDSIAYSQLTEGTGLSRRTVIYAIQNLEAKRIILVSKSRNALLNNPNTYRFNKDYETWVVQNSAPSVKKNRKQAKVSSAKLRKSKGSAKLGTKVVQNSVEKVNSFAPTKDTIQKTSTKDIASQSDAGLISQVIKLFEEVNPSFGRWYGNTTQRGAIDRLLVSHGYERLEKVIALLPKTNAKAYFPTITTPIQLETDWAKLKSKLEQEKDKQISKGRGLA
jgi:phage replication O-like protein O